MRRAAGLVVLWRWLVVADATCRSAPASADACLASLPPPLPQPRSASRHSTFGLDQLTNDAKCFRALNRLRLWQYHSFAVCPYVLIWGTTLCLFVLSSAEFERAC